MQLVLSCCNVNPALPSTRSSATESLQGRRLEILEAANCESRYDLPLAIDNLPTDDPPTIQNILATSFVARLETAKIGPSLELLGHGNVNVLFYTL